MEHETIIVINDADLSHGYFTFGTSKKHIYERLCRRIGGAATLKALRLYKNHKGDITWYDCKVPVEYLQCASFKIGSKRKSDGISRGFLANKPTPLTNPTN